MIQISFFPFTSYQQCSQMNSGTTKFSYAFTRDPQEIQQQSQNQNNQQKQQNIPKQQNNQQQNQQQKQKYQFTFKGPLDDYEIYKTMINTIGKSKYSYKEQNLLLKIINKYSNGKEQKQLLQHYNNERNKQLLKQYVDESNYNEFRLTEEKKGDQPDVVSKKITNVEYQNKNQRESYFKITQLFNKSHDPKFIVDELIKMMQNTKQKGNQELYKFVVSKILEQICERIYIEKKYIDDYTKIIIDFYERLTKDNQQLLEYLQSKDEQQQPQKYAFTGQKNLLPNIQKDEKQQQIVDKIFQSLTQELQNNIQYTDYKIDELTQLKLQNCIKVLAKLASEKEEKIYRQYEFLKLIINILRKSVQHNKDTIIDTITKGDSLSVNQQNNQQHNQQHNNQQHNQYHEKTLDIESQLNNLRQYLETIKQKKDIKQFFINLVCAGIKTQQQIQIQSRNIIKIDDKLKEVKDDLEGQFQKKKEFIDNVIAAAQNWCQQKSQQQQKIFESQHIFQEYLIAYLLYIIRNDQNLEALTIYNLDEVMFKQEIQITIQQETKQLSIDEQVDKIINDELVFYDCYKQLNPNNQNKLIQKLAEKLCKQQQDLQNILIQLKDDLNNLQKDSDKNQNKFIIQQFCSKIIQNLAYQKLSTKELNKNQMFQFVDSYVKQSKCPIYQFEFRNMQRRSTEEYILIKQLLKNFVREQYKLFIKETCENFDIDDSKYIQIIDNPDGQIDDIFQDEELLDILSQDDFYDEQLQQDYEIFCQADMKIRKYLLNNIDIQVYNSVEKQLVNQKTNKICLIQNLDDAIKLAEYIGCRSMYQLFGKIAGYNRKDQYPEFDGKYRNLNICVYDVLSKRIEKRSKDQDQQQNIDEDFGGFVQQEQNKIAQEVLIQRLEELQIKSKLPSKLVLQECYEFNKDALYDLLQIFINAKLVSQQELVKELAQWCEGNKNNIKKTRQFEKICQYVEKYKQEK